MSSITPGVNVPERSIGEGSAAESVFEASDMRDLGVSPTPGSGNLVGWVSGSETHHEGLRSVGFATAHPPYKDTDVASQGRFPEVQVGLLEVPELATGDELAEGRWSGDVRAPEIPVDE